MSEPGLPISVGVLDGQHGALSYAADEASRAGCNLQVVHAYTVPPRPPTLLSAVYGVDIDESFRQSGADVLTRAVEFLGAGHAGVRLHRVLERGTASQVLLEHAEISRLMVIGPDEARPWYRRLFESRVTRRLAERSPCPVVVVPDAWQASSQPTGVTLVLEAEATAEGPLRFALEMASRGEALTVIIIARDEVPSSHEIGRPVVTRLIGSWQALHPRVRVDTVSIAGSGDFDTLRSLEKTGVLVLGRSSGAALVMRSGQSLAQSVIERADCPVVVVPPSYDA